MIRVLPGETTAGRSLMSNPCDCLIGERVRGMQRVTVSRTFLSPLVHASSCLLELVFPDFC